MANGGMIEVNACIQGIESRRTNAFISVFSSYYHESCLQQEGVIETQLLVVKANLSGLMRCCIICHN